MNGDGQFFGEGMVITRNVDGERVTMGLKPDVLKRIEMIGKLNDRRERYKVAGDWESLLKLADEYEAKHMSTMAGMCRKEAEEHATVSPKHRRTRSRVSLVL